MVKENTVIESHGCVLCGDLRPRYRVSLLGKAVHHYYQVCTQFAVFIRAWGQAYHKIHGYISPAALRHW